MDWTHGICLIALHKYPYKTITETALVLGAVLQTGECRGNDLVLPSSSSYLGYEENICIGIISD